MNGVAITGRTRPGATAVTWNPVVRIDAAIRSASGARVQHWSSLFPPENSLFDQTNSLFRGVGNSKLKPHDISGLGGLDPACSRPNPRNSLIFPCKTGKSGQRRVRSRLLFSTPLSLLKTPFVRMNSESDAPRISSRLWVVMALNPSGRIARIGAVMDLAAGHRGRIPGRSSGPAPLAISRKLAATWWRRALP